MAVLLVVAMAYFTLTRLFLPGPVQAPENSTSSQLSGVVTDRSVAVLPFVNMSADAGNEHFSDGISDVQILVLQGKKEKAVAALPQAVEENWRSLWWYYLRRDPILQPLREEPAFQRIHR